MSLFKPNIARLEKKRRIGALIKALDHRDTSIRVAAAEALAETGDSRAVDPLISLLEDHDEDASLRKLACAALGADRRSPGRGGARLRPEG